MPQDKPTTLAQALLAFHSNPPEIKLDATNPHFKSKFASLPGVINSVRKPLTDAGLVLMQLPTTLDGQPALRTVLLHESGEREEDTMLLSADREGPQAQGSALTYARRYAALSILGLVGDEDDDANSANASHSSPYQAPKRKPITVDEEALRLAGQLQGLGTDLGAGPATRASISKNLANAENLAAHKDWLRRQIDTATKSLAQKVREAA